MVTSDRQVTKAKNCSTYTKLVILSECKTTDNFFTDDICDI